MSDTAPDPQARAAVAAMAGGQQLTEDVLGDQTVEERTVADKQWEAMKRRFAQQDTMIQAMIQIFSLLNGAVVLMVIVFWAGDFWRQEAIITENVIISIIGATIIQAGLAFMSITKFLFPSQAPIQGRGQSDAVSE